MTLVVDDVIPGPHILGDIDSGSGLIGVTIDGGTGNYTYSWSAILADGSSFDSSSEDLADLFAGTYSLTVTDENGCSIIDSIEVYENAPISTSISLLNTLCFGDSNAAVTINIFGGTTPYTVTFGGGSSVILPLTTFSSTYSNLSAGTYSIAVSDDENCSVSGASPTSITITEPDELEPNGSITSDYNGEDISCFGAADGEITASLSGGTPPYQYSIDNGTTFQSSTVFSGLTAGTYTIYYIDDNGCDTSENFTLNDPQDLSGSISISSQVNCFDGCDGELTFQVNNILTGTPGNPCLLYTSPSPRDRTRSRMPSSA